MYKVVIIGGGWSGCAAAVSARKAGAEVVLLEKTDLLLGLGNVGGIMRNNGRFTAAEENIALGATELFGITDKCSRHVNVDFPGHKHASLYDVMKVEPYVRRLLLEMGVEIHLMARAIDVEMETVELPEEQPHKYLKSIILADGSGVAVGKKTGELKIEGDVFVECTGSTEPYRLRQRLEVRYCNNYKNNKKSIITNKRCLLTQISVFLFNNKRFTLNFGERR